MKMKLSHFFLYSVIFFCLFGFHSVAATEVVLKDGVLVAQGVDDEYGVGAFNIILVHSSAVSFQLDEWVAPYTGAINSDWDEGTKVAGFTASVSPPNGDVLLCRFNVTGNGSVVIYVNEFYNSNGFPIMTANPTYGDGDTGPSSEPSSPGLVTGGTTDIIDATPTPQETREESVTPASTKEDGTMDNGEENPVVTQATQTVAVSDPTGSANVEKTQDMPLNTTKASVSPIMVIISICLSLFIVQRVYKE